MIVVDTDSIANMCSITLFVTTSISAIDSVTLNDNTQPNIILRMDWKWCEDKNVLLKRVSERNENKNGHI